MSGSNSRSNRLRRWLVELPPNAHVVSVEVMRGEEWEALRVATAEGAAERAAELGEAMSLALQDEADARGQGQRVVARAVAYGLDPEGRRVSLASISLRASASPDAEPLDEGAQDTTEEGRVQQQMQHNQALVRMSLEERVVTQKSIAQAFQAQERVIQMLLQQREHEAGQVDELRRALAESAPEWLEVVKALPTVMPALAPVLQRFAAGMGAKKSSLAKKAPDGAPPDPPPDQPAD